MTTPGWQRDGTYVYDERVIPRKITWGARENIIFRLPPCTEKDAFAMSSIIVQAAYDRTLVMDLPADLNLPGVTLGIVNHSAGFTLSDDWERMNPR